MDRRNFLRFLGLAPIAAVAPTKAYSFLGGILRRMPDPILRVPSTKWYIILEQIVNPPLIGFTAGNTVKIWRPELDWETLDFLKNCQIVRTPIE